MNKIIMEQIPRGADIPHLSVRMLSFNKEIINPHTVDWEMTFWVYPDKKVKVRYNAITHTFESLGEIPANVDLYEDKLTFYIKSSEEHFDSGNLKGQITIYLPNDKYQYGKQVIKSFITNLGITII